MYLLQIIGLHTYTHTHARTHAYFICLCTRLCMAVCLHHIWKRAERRPKLTAQLCVTSCRRDKEHLLGFGEPGLDGLVIMSNQPCLVTVSRTPLTVTECGVNTWSNWLFAVFLSVKAHPIVWVRCFVSEEENIYNYTQKKSHQFRLYIQVTLERRHSQSRATYSG